MAAGVKFPLNPKHPERTCWGCEKLCSAADLGCANGTIRTPHPCELFGDDWHEWIESRASPNPEPGPGNLEPGTGKPAPSHLEPVPR